MSTHLRPQALADRWGMRTTTLANWRSAGIGPGYIKLNGSTVLYPLATVEAFEGAGAVQTLDSIRNGSTKVSA